MHPESDDLRKRIDAILSDSSLDSHEGETSRCGEIEELIAVADWQSVHDCLLAVLEDDRRREDEWLVAAEVFWGGVLDGKRLAVDRLIALLYHRLPPDLGSNESNLAWSIASNLKGVGYLSEYDPLRDPAVQVEMSKITGA